MLYKQPDFTSEIDSETFIPPMIRLPQYSSSPDMVLTQQKQGVLDAAHKASQVTPFPQFPMTPPRTEPTGRPLSIPHTENDVQALLPRPQVPFPVQHRAIARSLRAGVIYIPPSMKRHAEPNIADALIACGTLLLLVICVLLLLYYFSV